MIATSSRWHQACMMITTTRRLKYPRKDKMSAV